MENIRTYISQLRSMFQSAHDRKRLESHPGGYRLVVDPEELDLLRFTTMAADGRQALKRGDYSSAAVVLGEAIELWRGAPLPELELGPAVRAKTVALEEQRWQVQADWISARLALGDHVQLVVTLRELIGERPLDEGLWCCLVTALYSMGRTGEALSAIAEARHTFVTELGIEPGPELRRIQAAVLGGEELLTVPRLGSSASSQSSATPRQLPASGPGFVGRQEELRQVRMLVDEAAPEGIERVKVVLVSGPPGVGKSATAVAAATGVRAAFPDGQLYLDLRGSTDSPLPVADALASLLGGFGIKREAIPDGVDERRALYRSLLAERKMLILLDDAVDAEQIVALIPGPGPSLVIVTSRRWLAGIQADAHLSLEPLTGGEAVSMLGGLVGSDRVAREPGAAREIVESCGRLPSAVRIAGIRLAARPKHPLQVIAERLTEKDHLLDELSLNGLCLRKQFEGSYQTLEPAAKKCFRMLSVLNSHHITAAGLGELLKLPVHAADRELERLVHEGLLSPGTTHRGMPCYYLPTVLHTYARERLAAEGPYFEFPENGNKLPIRTRECDRLRVAKMVPSQRKRTNARRPGTAPDDRETAGDGGARERRR